MEQINLNYKMYLLHYHHEQWRGTSNHFALRRFHLLYRDNPTSWCHQSWGRFCDRLLAVIISVITLVGLAMINVVKSIDYVGIGPILIISIVPAVIAAKVLGWFIKEFSGCINYCQESIMGEAKRRGSLQKRIEEGVVLLAVMIGVITLTGLTMIGVMNSIGYMGIGPILIISIVPAIIAAKILVWFIKEFIFITSLLLSAFTDWLFDKAD